jgi:ribonucleoside-diphosphate reductase alpha chain
MARLAQDVVPVVDEKATEARAHRPGGGRRRASQAGGPLGGPYGASFTGIGTPGLRLERRWTRPGVHPYDEVTWELRTASITNESGKVVFEQRDVEVPSFWSQLATNVVVSKYFRGHIGTPERERSVKQLIDRVVNTICGWAEAQHYFATPDDLETFRAELTHLLLHQKMSFNSPVWFNVGIEPKPQSSACFINSVEDNMGSIMDLAKTEAMLFKYGSGAGVNLSPIRSSKERMSGGGMASGPVSFMKGYDAFAGVIKCLTADTYITTGSGLLRIDEAIETDGPVGFTEDDSLTLNTPAGPKRISHVYRSPLADVRTVTLRTGLTLTGTHEHPVLTLASPFELRWTRLADLQPGDRVAVERRRELWPSRAPALDGFTPDLVVERRELRYPSEMTPELARLLGYLVAEGSVERERFRFSSADPEVMADYCRCVEAVFGVDPRSQVRHEINPSTGVRTESVSLSWKGALQFLAYCGLPAGPSAAKSVPVAIRRSPRSLVLEFLGAYSEGDAHIGEQRIEISSASKRLLEEIQLLALNMGVVGRRHSRNGYEHLTFLGADAARLARLLRPYLVTPRKRDAAATLAADRAGERNPNADVIPGLVPALRAFAIAGNGWFRSDAGDVVRSGFGIFNRSSDNVSYARARAIPDLTAKIARLSPGLANTVETVLEDEYLWDEVVSVADTGQALTYDFTVPEVHAFVSNGIVSHNSGGKTRRAAKMVILNVDHPDILEFIDSKANEEKKAWALIAAGYDPSFTGEAYGSVFFQNANHSVRVTDEFMKAVVEDREWTVRAVTTGEPLATYRAREIWRRMAEAAWLCGDPGVQYDTTINDWHTCANTDRIYASNPCVTGDTLVATDRGWRTIESLVGETVDVIGLDGRAHRVTRVFPTGRKPVFELKTRLGYRVKITADHKVRTERGDVAVKDLRPDDVILLDRPGFGRTTLSPNLAEAIGLAVGDGCLTWSEPNGRLQPMIVITMAAEEAPLLARIADEINAQKRLLRAVGAPGRGDAVHVTLGAGVSRLAFASRPVVERFMEYAVLDEGAELKRFKPAVYDLDRPSLAALLRGLFTADGTVGRNPRKGAYVGLDSTSLELLVQVQRLLLAFGIKSRIYENRRRGSLRTLLPNGRGGTATYRVKQVHALRISRTSRVTFEREIGFASESPKAAALRSANASATPRRELLSDRVGSVRPLGIEPVFDLTEPATHHFVANGLVVHNCSEFMFLNDTACNLASLNLMKFVGEDGEFDVEAFRHAARVTITAQEIIVDNASYPTPKIEERSHRFRPLGLGYANLGALLMSRGLPYDSDEGRNYAAAITAIMTGEAYRQSAIIARDHGGPFVEFEANREPFLRVIGKHREAAYRIPGTGVPAPMLEAARRLWDETVELGERHGYRNAQVTVLAPTGTIAFMMDCDTTGIEPDIALVKYKKLVGEGYLKIVNTTVPIALRRLGYSPAEVEEIVRYIDERETIEGAPHLRPEHLPVFDCAFKPVNGQRSIHYMGHVRMMAAVQPFLSGAISKTVNMPESATVEDIEQVYLEGWRLGLKAIAIYRDGSKKSQPLTAGKKTPEEAAAMAKEIEELRRQLAEAQAEALKPHRRRLPAERQAVTHKFEIAGHEGYITVGLYPDGQPGEIFLKMAKEGSTVSGLMDSFATAISLALQYGVPLRDLVNKFAHVRFEPSGFTGNPEIPIAKSIVDYIFRWLGSRFLPPDDRAMLGLVDRSAVVAAAPPSSGLAAATAPAPEEGLSAIDEATHRLEPAGEQPPAGGEPPRATATATAEAARAAATEGHAPAGNGRTGNGHLASGPGLALSLGGTKVSFQAQADAPSCPECGSIMVRNGSCYKCLNCGATSGCS